MKNTPAKPAIKKIVIQVGGKNLEFTPDEAKELKSILSDLFGGEKTNTVYVDRYPYHWNWPYSTTICGATTITRTGSSNGIMHNTSDTVLNGANWTGRYTPTSSTLTLAASN